MTSQGCGLTLLALSLPLLPEATPAARDLVWGGAAGLAGGVGVTLLYRALAVGRMAVVAPTTAVCAVMIPVVTDVVLGERLAPLTMLGIALAIVAIVLVSQQEAAAGPVSVRAWALPPGVGLALPSGVAIGLFFLALAETDVQAGMWPLVAARAVSVTLFGVIALVSARPWRMAAPVTRIAALVHGSRALGEPRSTSWPSWRQQVHDLDMQSSVHPKYTTQYHVGNWPAYDRALVQRGDITVWVAPDAIATWEAVGVGQRGGQRPYSDLAIETALTLRLIFHLPLRQTEGFLTSIFGMLGLDLSAPDHTTLSRRGQHLVLPLRRAPADAGLHLMVDSTGLSIVGEGEWAAAKHGGRGRRGWKTRHFGVDRSGVIVARALTEASVDDATTGITLIEATDGALGRVTADAASETIGFYEAAGARGATVVVPPTRTAHVSRYGPRSGARDRTILAVKERGRRRWKQTSGYHGQARVENAFFRYKSIIGDSLRACSPAGRGTEVVLACNILNQMTGLGRPMSYRIGR